MFIFTQYKYEFLISNYMKKILPVKYPVITGHPSTAGLFSILGNYEKTKEWIYSNYIQIAVGIRNGNIFAGGSIDTIILPAYHAEKTCPYIIHSLLTRDTVMAINKNILEFAVKMIDTENYLYLVADQQYFIDVHKFPCPHDMFIYGYDLEDEMLYAADFTFSDSVKYTYKEISMYKFKAGYEAIADKDDFHYYERGGVGLFHFDVNACYVFDIDFVKEQIREFVSSIDYSECFRSTDNPFVQREYGLRAYDLLSSFLRDDKEQCWGGRKSLAVLCDHKKLMVARLQYMIKGGYINNYNLLAEYEDMYNNQERLLLLFIKYEATKNCKYREKVAAELELIKLREKDCLIELLNELS